MKATIIFPLLLLFSFLANAQSFDAQSVYNQLETQKDVMVLSLKKDLIDAVDLDIDYKEHINRVEGDIHFMKTLIATSDESASAAASLIQKEMKKLNYTFTDLEEENSDNNSQKLFMYLKSKGEKISEVHFLSIDQQEHNTIFFTILGDLTLKE